MTEEPIVNPVVQTIRLAKPLGPSTYSAPETVLALSELADAQQPFYTKVRSIIWAKFNRQLPRTGTALVPAALAVYLASVAPARYVYVTTYDQIDEPSFAASRALLLYSNLRLWRLHHNKDNCNPSSIILRQDQYDIVSWLFHQPPFVAGNISADLLRYDPIRVLFIKTCIADFVPVDVDESLTKQTIYLVPCK